MKIHVVQSGDTLFTIAQKYGVDVDKLKGINKHLANPENLIPGMKIKIPSVSKPVKMEQRKEVEAQPIEQQQPVEHPYKDMSPKMQPVLEADMGEEFPVKKMMPYLEGEAKIPSLPKMPKIEEDEVKPTSVKHAQFAQYHVSMPTQYQAVPYPQVHYKHHHVPKPCGCSSPFTYYMPVYPMQNPYQHQSYQGNPFINQQMLGMEQYNKGHYPEMNLDGDESTLELPEVPEQLAAQQSQGNWGQQTVPYGQQFFTNPYMYPNQGMQQGMQGFGPYGYQGQQMQPGQTSGPYQQAPYGQWPNAGQWDRDEE